MAYEWQIDLCNRTKSSIWLTVPAHTDQSPDGYWQKLAKLLHETLDPSLKIYVEYSNEIWNYGFEQANYMDERGVAIGMPGGNKYIKGYNYYVKASADLWKVFLDEFGTADRDRLELVLAGQAANTNHTSYYLMPALKNATINQQQIMPDVFAIAPYTGHGLDASDPKIFEKLLAELSTTTEGWLKAQKKVADENGLKLVTYEGGQHLWAHGGDARISVNKDPRMGEFYTKYLDVMSNYVSLYMNFVYNGQIWGSKYNISDVNTDYKYEAIQDWITNH